MEPISVSHEAINEPSPERIELGRRLFYDPILSSDSTISCASCHKQEYAFADNRPISFGVKRRLGTRNAPTLANVGQNPTVLFDGFLKTLEVQVLVPIEEHAEMDHNIVLVSKRLNRIPKYVELSQKAYGRAPDPFVITRSISVFQRSLLSQNSKFDQFLKGEVELTREEKKGMNLFMNKLHCTTCHSGYYFTNYSVQNNGLEPNAVDSGRMRVTKLEVDRDLFKVPTLRNIQLTAPYMHDGRFSSLEDVIRHYASGGLTHPNKNQIIRPFNISNQEIEQLITFLNTLTDEQFIHDKKIGPPEKW